MSKLILMPALLHAACSLPCPALERTSADDEIVANTTALEIRREVGQATGPVDLHWETGDSTTVSVALDPQLGTAQLDQRRDCLDQCLTTFELSMACSPDRLRLELWGTLSTADSTLVDQPFVGTVSARRTGADELHWSGYAEIPEADLLNGFDPRAQDVEPPSMSGELSLVVWLEGVDGVLTSVDLGYTIVGEQATVVAGLTTAKPPG